MDYNRDWLSQVNQRLLDNPTRTVKSDLQLYFEACKQLQDSYTSPGATPQGELEAPSSSLKQRQPAEQNIYGGSYIIGSLPFPVDIKPSLSTVNTSTPITTSTCRKRNHSEIEEDIQEKEAELAQLEHTRQRQMYLGYHPLEFDDIEEQRAELARLQYRHSKKLKSIETLVAPHPTTRLSSVTKKRKSQRKNNSQHNTYKGQNSSMLSSSVKSHSRPQPHLQHDSFDSSFNSVSSYKTHPTQLIPSHSYVQHQQQQDFSTRYSLRRRHSISSDEEADLRSQYELLRKTNVRKTEQRIHKQKAQNQQREGVVAKKKQSQKHSVVGPRGVEKKQVSSRYNLRATRARVKAIQTGW